MHTRTLMCHVLKDLLKAHCKCFSTFLQQLQEATPNMGVLDAIQFYIYELKRRYRLHVNRFKLTAVS